MRTKQIIMAGCGGIGSYLLPALAKTAEHWLANAELIIIDGDTVEKKNLDRQVFKKKHIGKSKAEVLCKETAYPIICLPFYFQSVAELRENGIAPNGSTFWICGVDNHPTRRNIIEAIDETQSRGVIAANETTDAEAYYYDSRWSNTRLDPRVYYPEIVQDTANDPRHPEGCTGAAAIAGNPQLPTANQCAASFALKLLEYYGNKQTKEEEWEPVRYSCNRSRFSTETIKDLLQ